MRNLNGYFKFLLYAHGILLLGILFWISPITHLWCKQLDASVFTFLNSLLIKHTHLQAIMGMLNNRFETKLNLLFAIILNILAIFATKDKELAKTRISQLLYFWLCFQIGYMLQDWFFNTALHLERLSPSLVIESTFKLSEVLGDPNIKDSSIHSFPSGHAFSMIFWASFTFLCAPRTIGIFCLIFGIFLSVPRLFSGAHWLSDILFSSTLALCWLSWTLLAPFYHAKPSLSLR